MSTDIKKGDLVKATHKVHPDEAITGRVQHVDAQLVSTATRSISRKYFDFEVLERPGEHVPVEVLEQASEIFYATTGKNHADLKAVINFIREYDRNNTTTKENA